MTAQVIRNNRTLRQIDASVLQKTIGRNRGMIHMSASVAKMGAK